MSPRHLLATAAALGLALLAVLYVQGPPIPYPVARGFGIGLLLVAAIALVATLAVGVRAAALQVARWRVDWRVRRETARRVR